MKNYYLFVKWDYKYDKEGWWIENYSGENEYELVSGASYELPRIWEKSIEILSVETDGDAVAAELDVANRIVSVKNDGVFVKVHASDDYMVCGDSVSQDLWMEITIIENEK